METTIVNTLLPEMFHGAVIGGMGGKNIPEKVVVSDSVFPWLAGKMEAWADKMEKKD